MGDNQFFLVTSLPSKHGDHQVSDATATAAQQEFVTAIEELDVPTITRVLWNDAAHLQKVIELTLIEMGHPILATREYIEVLATQSGQNVLREKLPFLHLYQEKKEVPADA